MQAFNSVAMSQVKESQEDIDALNFNTSHEL